MMALYDQMTSEVVSKDEVARDLGFYDTSAFQEWQRHQQQLPDEQTRWLLAEICNLRAEVRDLRQAVRCMSPI